MLLNAQQEVLFRQTFAFAFAFAHFLVRHYEAWHLRAVSGLGLRTFDSGLQTSDYGLLSREWVTKPIKRLSIGPDGDAGQAKTLPLGNLISVQSTINYKHSFALELGLFA